MSIWVLDEATKKTNEYVDQEISALEALFADSRIVESGSNENGQYWRWESGLQVCVFSTMWNSSRVGETFGTYTFGDVNINRTRVHWIPPAEFVDTPAYANFVGNIYDSGGNPGRMMPGNVSANSTGSEMVFVVNHTRTAHTIRDTCMVAIGRWK